MAEIPRGPFQGLLRDFCFWQDGTAVSLSHLYIALRCVWRDAGRQTIPRIYMQEAFKVWSDSRQAS